MRIELTCSSCGQNRFSFPNGGGDNAMVSCADCGQDVGSLGTLKDRVERAVLSGMAPMAAAEGPGLTGKGRGARLAERV